MAEEGKKKKPLVIKKYIKHGGGHHGGAWKIAYADFVTAMMAFFLLMWLLYSLNTTQLQGISSYFKPTLKVGLVSGEGFGTSPSIMDGQSTRAVDSIGINSGSGSQAIEDTGEVVRMNQLAETLEKTVREDPKLKDFSDQVIWDISEDGLQLHVMDTQNAPMFAPNSDELEPSAKAMFGRLAKFINIQPNPIVISGHTDNQPYTGPKKNYTNWELSADRAAAANRELLAQGLFEDKVLRLVGVADTQPLIENYPENPSNRRVMIVILKQKAAEDLRKKGLLEESPEKPVPPSTP